MRLRNLTFQFIGSGFGSAEQSVEGRAYAVAIVAGVQARRSLSSVLIVTFVSTAAVVVRANAIDSQPWASKSSRSRKQLGETLQKAQFIFHLFFLSGWLKASYTETAAKQ